jgi:hypothetical protein
MKLRFVVLALLASLPLLVGGQPELTAKKGGFELTNLQVSIGEILNGGPIKDGIPSIDQPKFIKGIDLTSYLADDDLVIGVSFNGVSKAYPINILNYHEIVNDKIEELPITVSWCPLCNSGIVFNAAINEKILSFGVSGLLYQSDVLLYDRETESLWSQILGKAISGRYAGTSLTIIPSKITTWKAWKSKYPGTLLLSDQTGRSRNYRLDPYSDYYEKEATMFPIDNPNKQFSNKEKVLVLKVNEKIKIYPFKRLKKVKEEIVEDSFEGKAIHIHFDSKNNTAFALDKNNALMEGHTMFWFAANAFFPDAEIYKLKKKK